MEPLDGIGLLLLVVVAIGTFMSIRDQRNKKRIESGEHARYKREKRKEGAKESYYG